jgi:membrane-associated protease RseP (regulator of RpoE activity)
MTDNSSATFNYGWNQSKNLELEYLKHEVGLRFPFYDVKFNSDGYIFLCNIDKETLSSNFESLRINLSKKGYIPILRHNKEKHLIYITKKPKRKERSIWINIALLIATIITTILTGSLLHIGYNDLQTLPDKLLILSPENLFYGTIFFSLPLMSILFIHEMGHYLVSKKHGLKTSLPFFLPIPPIVPGFNIGTFGALISSGEPMPDKKSLFDVGISGPIAGFIIALPVTIIGLIISNPIPEGSINPGELILGSSILFQILTQAFISLPNGYILDLSPVAFAGWIGLLITSINLLPAGQLDGGHIFRAVLGNKQKYAGWIAIFIMIFSGWILFALIIILLIGMVHPPPLNDDSDIDIKRKLLFIVAVIMLIICFIPYPISMYN